MLFVRLLGAPWPVVSNTQGGHEPYHALLLQVNVDVGNHYSLLVNRYTMTA